MRIAGSEYLKLFSNKIFLICIIAFFCADSLFFVMLQSSDYYILPEHLTLSDSQTTDKVLNFPAICDICSDRNGSMSGH